MNDFGYYALALVVLVVGLVCLKEGGYLHD